MSIPAIAHLPAGPVTATEWEEMPESELRIEVVDGIIQVSPSPSRVHQRIVGRLYTILRGACPQGLECVLGVDVRLTDEPLNVRWPDVLVLRPGEGPVRAEDVVLAVEVVSPGSRRIDRVYKRQDYAEAGIPNYWIIDPSGDQVRLTAYAFAGADEQVEARVLDFKEGGEAELTEPFLITIDLDALPEL